MIDTGVRGLPPAPEVARRIEYCLWTGLMRWTSGPSAGHSPIIKLQYRGKLRPYVFLGHNRVDARDVAYAAVFGLWPSQRRNPPVLSMSCLDGDPLNLRWRNIDPHNHPERLWPAQAEWSKA